MHPAYKPDNVISMRSTRRAPRQIAPKAANAISDCRELALNRICDLVRQAFDRIEEDLFALAEKSADRELQALYLEARTQAREKRSGIEGAFRQRFLGEFDGKVRGDAAAPPQASPKLELSLVDDAELAESLAMSSMANKLKSGAEEELGALTKRLGFLLDEPDLPGEFNPLSPESVCKAIQEACSQITAGYEVKLMLMRLFEQHVARDLPQVYRDVNARLVELHQVLPDIRVTYRAPVQPTQRPASSRTGTPAGGTSAGRSGAASVPAADLDKLSVLQQLLGTGLLPARVAAMPSGTTGLATEQLMGRLTDLQHAVAPPAFSATTARALPAQAGTTVDPAVNLADALNVLREIGAGSLSKGASQVDTITIDIVAMVFDYVFNDRQIPAAIKALLARLQIPVLKAALLDKGFFSQRSHPARVLLDGLADLALQCDDAIGPDHADYRFIDELVTGVQSDFATDVEVFNTASAALRDFMVRREATGIVFDEQSAKLLHDRERREIARLVAESFIQARLDGMILPPAVVVMLKARWVDVLCQAHLAGGEEGTAWQTACEVIDDLLWSLTARFGPAERKRLVSLLPRMLRILQQGLAAINADPGERDRFFATLVAHHTMAVKSGLKQADVGGDTQTLPALDLIAANSVDVPPPAPAPEEIEFNPGEPGLMRIHLEADGVKVEELRLSERTGGVVDMALPPSLVRGTWVEFRRPDGALRAKLSWISPHKGVLLFTNPSSARAVSLTPDVFALQLRDGLVRIISEAPLSERAVDSVLEDLRAA